MTQNKGIFGTGKNLTQTPNKSPKRILVVKLSAIGDVLMATPTTKALRTAFPESYIAWVVERKSAEVVIGNPYLDEVIIWDRVKTSGHWNDSIRNLMGFVQLKSKLREKHFDVCLDMQGLLRSALVSLASGASRRIGFADAGEKAHLFYTETYDPGKSLLVAQQRNLDLLKPVGVESTDTDMHMPVSDDDRAFAAAFFKDNDLTNRKVIAFLPATTWVNKHWTIEGWSALANTVATKYNAVPLIFGSKADINMAQQISDGASNNATFKSGNGSTQVPNNLPVIAAGQTTLKQAGALMELCNVVVGVDTGLLHMSVALNRPSIGLFGASVWRCFLKRENFIWISKDFDCSPCLRHPTCENVDCMRAISHTDIDQAIEKLI